MIRQTWARQFPAEMRKMTKADLDKAVEARKQAAESQMKPLMEMGLNRTEAWSEVARTCLMPPETTQT